MAGLRELFRRWQIEHSELHSSDLERARFRSHTMLGAYGLSHLDNQASQHR